MKSCLNFKTWLMPLIAILLMGNVISAEAQSVRVLNSNPDKGGGGLECILENSYAVSMYVVIDKNRVFNIDLIEVGGLEDQIATMNISEVLPEGESNASRIPSDEETWKVDLTLINPLSHYSNSTNNLIYFDVTISHGIDDGSSNPDLTVTETHDVHFCTKVGVSRLNLEAEPSISVKGVSPNPARDKTTLNVWVSEKSEMSITLMNGVGQKVRTISGSQNLDKGEYTKEIDLSDLNKGVYYLVILMDDTILTEKILKL